MIRRVETIEVIWTILTALGLLVQIRYLARALGDRAWLIREALNTSAEIATSGNVRREKFRVGGQTLLFLVGLTAMLNKPGTVRPARGAGDWIAIVLFLAFASVIIIEGLLDSQDRKKIIRAELKDHDDARQRRGQSKQARSKRRWWF